MAKMTVLQVGALKAREKPYKKTVDTGLMIRIAPTGIKTWIVHYMIDGKQREYSLPKPWAANSNDGYMSLADACAMAASIRALARSGVDYKVMLEQERMADIRRQSDLVTAENVRIEHEKIEQLTVLDLFELWLTDGVRRQDGNAELKRSFHADVLPTLGKTRIKDLDENNLRAVLRTLVSRGVNRAAVVMRNNLMQMFTWAEKRQPWRKLLADGNPMDLIEIEKVVAPGFDLSYERDRILYIDEIKELRDIFDDMHRDYFDAQNKRTKAQPIEQTTQRAVWIMLSTMCRVGELLMARWEHVNFNDGKWLIPKENVKAKLAKLEVYLSPFAMHHFRQLHALTGHSEWCFPAKSKEGHVCVKSVTKQVGDRQAMFKKGKDGNPRKPMKNRRHDNTLVLGAGKNGAWTPHDLRRTGATMMQSLGVSFEIIDRCQNHVLPGSKTRRHYLHHDYVAEKREAWRLLGERLALILNHSENIVVLC